MKRSLTSLMTIAAIGLATPSFAADLVANIKGVSSTDGTIRAALHDGSEGFPGNRKIVAGMNAPAETGDVAITFKDVAAGEYAVVVFHDQDGDENLSTNFLGIPSEPIGFSRDARGSFGPPKFEDAVVVLGEDNLIIDIDLVN